jgi:S-adenosylmethionine-diacylglycerol 3-amino-3-carboxypropyl transferase
MLLSSVAPPRPVSRNFLRDALRYYDAGSLRAVQERAFAWWFDGLVYPQIWEDPRVDARALRLDRTSRILTIASGGCNTLNYLVHNPERIVALDLNRSHVALTRLKKAVLKRAPSYEVFYRFFGRSDDPANVDFYDMRIGPYLDAATRSYWESRTWTGSRRIRWFANDIYRRGRLGSFMRWARQVGRALGYEPCRAFEADTMDAQRALFDMEIRPFFEHRLVRMVLRLPVALFSLGIPPQQRRRLMEDGISPAEVLANRMRRLICNSPLQENYFAWQALRGRYDHRRRGAVPDYLRKRHFEALRCRLSALTVQRGSLHNYLARSPKGAFNAFVLLDAQDWMSAHRIAELWTCIAEVAQPGARIIFRTAGRQSPVETALPRMLRRRFTYDAVRSRALHADDRSGVYGMFHLYKFSG